MRTGKELEEAVEFCKSRGLEFYAHNSNYPSEVLDKALSRKVVADLYIDDRNLGGLPDWGVIYQQIVNPNAKEEAIYSDSKQTKKNKSIFSFIGKLKK